MSENQEIVKQAASHENNIPVPAESVKSKDQAQEEKPKVQLPPLRYIIMGLILKITTNPKVINRANKTIEKMDFAIDYIINPKSTKYERDEVMQYTRQPVLFGIWVIIITFGVCGLWSVTAPLDSASHASGIVVVESNRKVVQHLEGGIIEAIHIKDGDKVKKDQPLITLSTTKIQANVDSTMHQLYNLKANVSRINAELGEKNEIEFDEVLLKIKDKPEVAKIIESQTKLLELNKRAIAGKIDVLQKGIEASKSEIIALEARLKGSKAQEKVATEQYNNSLKLIKDGISSKTQHMMVEAKLAEIKGQSAALTASIDERKQAMAAKESDLLNVKNQFINERTQELKDTMVQVARIEDGLRDLNDTLKRSVIRAPLDGIVKDLRYHTIGGIVEPRQPIMEITPQNDKLIIEARVLPNDIYNIDVGMTARVKVSAFKSRSTPDIIGKVTYVSSDLSFEPNGGAFYKARIDIPREENPILEKLELYPGMMADVLIVNGSRTLMKYLLDPILDSMRLAFREK
jgi:HlyD family secretion protein